MEHSAAPSIDWGPTVLTHIVPAYRWQNAFLVVVDGPRTSESKLQSIVSEELTLRNLLQRILQIFLSICPIIKFQT